MPGLLKIKGFIDLEQFWPAGSSDADTSKVKVTVAPDSFEFAADRKTFKRTRVFNEAYVRGASHRKLIDAQSRITVRLQGIDAPELHYRASPLDRNRPEVTEARRQKYNELNRTERRQYLAESATIALSKKLKSIHKKTVECRVYSLVDRPYEVVDTYGRFVANIMVGKGFRLDVNIWLTEAGWVYPTFYSSMEKEEIEALLTAMKEGQKAKRVWKYYSLDTGKFEARLIYRGEGAEPDPAADKGPVLMPKLFRRQVGFQMEKRAQVSSGAFVDFLRRSPDDCYTLADFLKAGPNSAATRKLHEFMKGTKFTLKPHELVFREKFSTVVTETGKVIEAF
ncbi:thermonuclease family protein [Taklimakanibacter lacteus]|uniref:thermonuclease family protein n=1 Tax=Taklimakanibacter lacteus TaxID=2268456 RepID=UPI0013C52296